jgi:hypothetical protein
MVSSPWFVVLGDDNPWLCCSTGQRLIRSTCENRGVYSELVKLKLTVLFEMMEYMERK